MNDKVFKSTINFVFQKESFDFDDWEQFFFNKLNGDYNAYDGIRNFGVIPDVMGNKIKGREIEVIKTKIDNSRFYSVYSYAKGTKKAIKIVQSVINKYL